MTLTADAEVHHSKSPMQDPRKSTLKIIIALCLRCRTLDARLVQYLIHLYRFDNNGAYPISVPVAIFLLRFMEIYPT